MRIFRFLLGHIRELTLDGECSWPIFKFDIGLVSVLAGSHARIQSFSLHEKTFLQIFTLVVKVSKGIIKIRLNFTLTLLNVKLLFTLHLLQYKETDYLYLSLRLNQR